MKKFLSSWKLSAWLEKCFLVLSFLVALFAIVVLILWSLVTFYIPFQTYSIETEKKDLSNGQTLRVIYPNLILGDNKPAEMILIFAGTPSCDEASFTIDIPPGLIVKKPKAQEYGTQLEVTSSGSGNDMEPEEIKISLVNARSEHGLGLSVIKRIHIKSPQMQDPISVDIGVETIFWIALQSIVNNPENEKNALILFIASLLSGAGTLILQYMKTQQDRMWEEQKSRRDRIAGVMRDDYEGVISTFLQLHEKMGVANLTIYEELLQESNWRDKLQVSALKYLQQKDGAKAKRIADYLIKLCDAFNSKEDKKLFQSLLVFSDLVSKMKHKQLKDLEANVAENMLTATKNWQDELSSTAIDLIQYFGSTSEAKSNYQQLKKVLGEDEFGKDLLERSNLQYILKTQSIELDESDKEIFYYLNWRPLWTSVSRKPSAKALRWLQQNGVESSSFTLPSEYAELDQHLMDGMISLPVLEQIGNPYPTITFAAEGMGKTAAALWWIKKCQDAARSSGNQTKIFPIYASFEITANTREWIVETSSRAITQFISDNPRRFLNAPDIQKNAMCRLMLHHAKNAEVLCSSLRSSAFASVTGDTDRIVEYVQKSPFRALDNLSIENIISLFSFARPEGFDQIYFIWDNRSAISNEDLSHAIEEIEPLILPLAGQNVVIKVFAPLTAKKASGKIFGSSSIHDIVWSDQKLRELLDRRIDKFEALWKPGTKDPTGLVVSKANSSPRRVISIINKIFEHVEMYFEEDDKLTPTILK